MTFFVLPSIGTLAFDVGNLLATSPALINEVAGHALAHALYSHVRRARPGRGISRRQSRKLANRKRRWFVDNIIMHHKRLHDRNREIVISNARTRALAKRKSKEEQKPSLANSPSLQRDQSQSSHWRNRIDSQRNLKQKGSEIRSRLEARQLRARSRWLALSGS